MIEVKETDKAFRDSPDTGKDCLCSRCGKPIMDMAIRVWDEPENPRDMREWRFHVECVGGRVVDTFGEVREINI